MYSISLIAALAVFCIGVLYKVSTWFRYTIDPFAAHISPAGRVQAAMKGTLRVLFSARFFTLLEVFVLDVVFQRRIFKESLLRWAMHMSIFTGFMLLLVFHALANQIPGKIFSGYYSTLNPYLFLRNLAGALVIAGLLIAVYRRLALKPRRFFSNVMDWQMIVILAVVMVSGILLEAGEMSSYSAYKQMVDDYADVEDEESIALESYWVKNFAVVSPNISEPFDPSALTLGREMHLAYCSECHSNSHWAFMSYGTAKSIRPLAGWMESKRIDRALWTIHFLASFVGLAWLPFSKLFHVFVSPLSLLINAVMKDETSDPANIATRQILELDACTHCGTCTMRCSVGTAFEEISNVYILPSEKIGAARMLAVGKDIDPAELDRIQAGLYLCTNCHKCTDVCPVGINLQQMWFNLREFLLQQGRPELQVLSCLSLYRGLNRDKINPEHYVNIQQLAHEAVAGTDGRVREAGQKPLKINSENKILKGILNANTRTNSLWSCYSCCTCSNSCPVVANYQNPRQTLGLLPHQIIQAAKMGLSDLIFKANMLRDCLWCYACQQNCPQNVQVADILFELKNLAISAAQNNENKNRLKK